MAGCLASTLGDGLSVGSAHGIFALLVLGPSLGVDDSEDSVVDEFGDLKSPGFGL